MNDNTTQLIEKLAKQFGTTTEYLWGILVRQAPISATINLGICILIVIFWIVLIRLHKSFSNNDNDINYNDDEWMTLPMAIGGFIAVVLVGVFITMLKMAFIGYTNPEYWALQFIIDRI